MKRRRNDVEWLEERLRELRMRESLRNEHGELLDRWGDSAEERVGSVVDALNKRIDELNDHITEVEDNLHSAQASLEEIQDSLETFEIEWLEERLRELRMSESLPWRLRAVDSLCWLIDTARSAHH